MPMVTDGSDEVLAIAREIERYVGSHPEAADSAAGIAAWWLRESECSLSVVEAALDKLVREAVLQVTRLPDGTLVYCAPQGQASPSR
jgi:hypothetical protein